MRICWKQEWFFANFKNPENVNYKEAVIIVSNNLKYLTWAIPRWCPCFNSKFDDCLNTNEFDTNLFNNEFDHAIRLALSIYANNHGNLQYAEQQIITANGCAPTEGQINLQSSLERLSLLLLTSNCMIMLYEIAE